jgi:hypothetical protein
MPKGSISHVIDARAIATASPIATREPSIISKLLVARTEAPNSKRGGSLDPSLGASNVGSTTICVVGGGGGRTLVVSITAVPLEPVGTTTTIADATLLE